MSWSSLDLSASKLETVEILNKFSIGLETAVDKIEWFLICEVLNTGQDKTLI